MQPNQSGSLLERIIAWLRGLFASGERAGGQASERGRSALEEARARADQLRAEASQKAEHAKAEAEQRAAELRAQAGEKAHELRDRADQALHRDGAGAGHEAEAGDAGERQVLPDLDATDSDYAYPGEGESYAETHGDLDETDGSVHEGERFDLGSGDQEEALHLHDAVGGHDEDADEDTERVIDTTRDRDLGGVSDQDELTAFEGASADEFDAGGVPAPDVTVDDVESAAEGHSDRPEAVAYQHDMDESAGAGDTMPEVREYNYGLGDLGVSGSGAGGSAAEADADAGTGSTGDLAGVGADVSGTADGDVAGDDVDRATGMDAEIAPIEHADTPSSAASRTDTESAAAGDAAMQGDEAVGAPGGSAPEAFGDVTTGTTEPSRSAVGNDVDEDMDALGTTLEYTEDEESPYDAENANLSGQDELFVSEGEDDTGRVTTFQSGTIAHEGVFGEEPATESADATETTDSYADFPDEPEHESADDSGSDDFSGSEYPSDRIVDRLDGDDPWDAVTPDVDEQGSSYGDLDRPASGEDLLVAEEGLDTETTGEYSPVDRTLDQDVVGTSDEHVGGEEPDFAEAASLGTDETATGDLAPGAEALDETLAGSEGEAAMGDAGVADLAAPLGADAAFASSMDAEAAVEADAFASGEADLADEATGADLETAGSTATGGMGVSDGGAPTERGSGGDADVPAGAVRGDAGGEVPEGYPIKGNANSMIYHLPHFPSYPNTKAEFYFATEDDAIAAGYRAPGRRNRGRAQGDGGSVVTADTAAATSETVTETASEPAAAEAPGGDPDAPAGAVRGDGTNTCPPAYPIKGNAGSMIYHTPERPSYDKTIPEWCFATEEDALNAGFRAPKR